MDSQPLLQADLGLRRGDAFGVRAAGLFAGYLAGELAGDLTLKAAAGFDFAAKKEAMDFWPGAGASPLLLRLATIGLLSADRRWDQCCIIFCTVFFRSLVPCDLQPARTCGSQLWAMQADVAQKQDMQSLIVLGR